MCNPVPVPGRKHDRNNNNHGDQQHNETRKAKRRKKGPDMSQEQKDFILKRLETYLIPEDQWKNSNIPELDENFTQKIVMIEYENRYGLTLASSQVSNIWAQAKEVYSKTGKFAVPKKKAKFNIINLADKIHELVFVSEQVKPKKPGGKITLKSIGLGLNENGVSIATGTLCDYNKLCQKKTGCTLLELAKLYEVCYNKIEQAALLSDQVDDPEDDVEVVIDVEEEEEEEESPAIVITGTPPPLVSPAATDSKVSTATNNTTSSSSKSTDTNNIENEEEEDTPVVMNSDDESSNVVTASLPTTRYPLRNRSAFGGQAAAALTAYRPEIFEIKLHAGASDKLKQVVVKHFKQGGKRNVAQVDKERRRIFCCSTEKYNELKNNQMPAILPYAPREYQVHEFLDPMHKVNNKAYADGRRVQLVVDTADMYCDDEPTERTIGSKVREDPTYIDIRKHIETELQNRITNLREGNNNVVKKVVLMETTKYPYNKQWKEVLRQQLHQDMKTFKDDEYIFILPLDDGQDLWIQNEDGELKKILLKKDELFVAKSDLIHAGTNTIGMRLHGIFVPSTKPVGTSDEEETNFIDDPTYPRDGSFIST